MPTIKLEQWPSVIEARRGRSILDAALAAGVPYPHSCRSGECGACKSELRAGEVLMDGYDSLVLSQAERDSGLILACRAYPRSDVEIAWLCPATTETLPPVRRLQAVVAQAEAATHDIMRLRLAVEGPPLGFAAGQYAELQFDGCPARPYSMANRPGDSVLEFHVRHVPGGTVSGYVAQEARVGARVQVEGPYGTAFLREPVDTPILLVAGGSGLAPMKSILLALRDQQLKSPVHLYHGVRDARDLYDEETIAEAWVGDVRYIPVLSSPSRPSACRQGFVHQAVARDFATLSGFKIYLAGPPPMVDACSAIALRLGAHPGDVHADAFYGAREKRRPAARRRPGKKGFFRGLFPGG